MQKDSLIKPVALLLITTAVVSVINFIYNIVFSRLLSVSDFADLRALFSILMIFAVPISAIQTMLAKFTAEYFPTEIDKLKSVCRQSFSGLLALGLLVILLFAGLRYPIAGYLRVTSVNLVALLGPLVLILLIQHLILGIYQGLQRFVLFAANLLAATILKLLFGIIFVYYGWATLGALVGLIIAGISAVLIFGPLLAVLFRRQQSLSKERSRQPIYGYSGYALGVLICFAIISQIDILIVKHKFLPQEAGYYACAAIIGKGFLFLPIPAVTVLFPKVVANNKIGKSSLAILIRCLLISLALCLVGIAICFFFTDHLIKIFGSKYMPAGPLLKIFGLAMTPLALFYVLMNYFLSEYRLKFFYYCLLVCLLGTVVLLYWPQTLTQFLLILGWYGLLIFLPPLVYILFKERRFA